jgi:hypothetical protein
MNDVATIVPDAAYATFVNTFRCQPPDQGHIVRVNIEIVEEVASLNPDSSLHLSTAALTAPASSTTSSGRHPQHLADMSGKRISADSPT